MFILLMSKDNRYSGLPKGPFIMLWVDLFIHVSALLQAISIQINVIDLNVGINEHCDNK